MIEAMQKLAKVVAQVAEALGRFEHQWNNPQAYIGEMTNDEIDRWENEGGQ